MGGLQGGCDWALYAGLGGKAEGAQVFLGLQNAIITCVCV